MAWPEVSEVASSDVVVADGDDVWTVAILVGV